MTVNLQTSPVTAILQKRNTIAWIIFFVVIAILLITAPDIGLTWDEPAYITAAESYLAWLELVFTNPGEAFSFEAITQFWTPNHEHPPLDKVWSGLVWGIGRHIFDDLVAHRLGNMLLVAAMTALLYFLVAEEFGNFAGLAAAGSLIAMPRFFFHAHLAALDVPIAFMVFLVTFMFWRSADTPSWQWTLLLSLVWGAALATKVNAFFILPTLGLWVIIFRRRVFLIFRLIIMGIIGGAFSLLLWPWLYFNTIQRLVDYIRFITVDHWEIGVYYLGKFYMPPPWHYAIVITWAVVPWGILLCAILGMIHSIRNSKGDRGFGWLLILNVIVPLAALSTGQSMVYDGERLFMPAFSFLAGLAAIGIIQLSKWVSTRIADKGFQITRAWISILLLILIFIGPLTAVVQLYPHLLSYYSFGVGGLPGAVDLGLETTYWCESYLPAVEYINEHAEQGDKVWVEPWSHDVLVYYKLHGQMRADLEIVFDTNPWVSSVFGNFRDYGVKGYFHNADFVIYQNRPTQLFTQSNPISLDWIEKNEPVFEIVIKGEPLVMVFDNRQ